MAFGAVQQFPNDTRPRIGIGVNIPFNEGGVFTPNYTTAEAIKSSLINYYEVCYKDLIAAEQARKVQILKNLIKRFIPFFVLKIIKKIRNKKINY